MSGQKAKNYYYQHDPFFTNQNQKNSKWHGKNSELFNLSGQVKQQDFLNALMGNDPQKNKIVQDGLSNKKIWNEEKQKYETEFLSKHRACIDIPFSAPKSVSICALHLGDFEIIKAHDQAVKNTINFMEQNYIYYRITKNKKTQMKKSDNGLFATFKHSTSRENDPQLHTHTLLFNMTNCPDNKIKATANDLIFKDQKYINSVYQSELAMALKKLGYSIEIQPNGNFEIAGVSKKAIKTFSKRRKAIDEKEQELKTSDDLKGVNESVIKNMAVLDSRPDKETKITMAELIQSWEKQYPSSKIKLKNQEHQKLSKQECITKAHEILHETESTFTKPQIIDTALRLSRGYYIDKDMQKAFDKTLKNNEVIQIAETTFKNGLSRKIYSSQNMQKIESEIVTLFWSGINKYINPHVPIEKITDHLQKNFAYFNQGQKDAVELILTGANRFSVIQGDAGTGKTSCLKAVNQILKQYSDMDIIGLSYTGKAAAEIQEKSGIPSQTITSFLQDENNHQQSNKIWIIDESSMAGSKQLHKLMQLANKYNSKIVLVGDGKQLQAISAGKIFKDIQKSPYAEIVHMEEVLRQKTPHMIKAVQAIKDQDIEKAFENLEVKESEDNDLLQSIIDDYTADTKDKLIVTASNSDREQINNICCQKLKDQGVISHPKEIQIRKPLSMQGTARYHVSSYEKGQHVQFGKYSGVVTDKNPKNNTITVNTEKWIKGKKHTKPITVDLLKTKVSTYKSQTKEFGNNSRIVLLKNNTKQKIQNGNTGTIVNIKHNQITVKLDNNKTITLNPKTYPYFDHGYAVTAHKSQGQTCKQVYIYANTKNGYQHNTEFFYVAVSRAETNAKIYTTNKETLKKQCSQEQEKTSTLERNQNEKDKTHHSKNL